MKNEKKRRKKYARMPFSEESHLYTYQPRMKHKKWHWGIWYPCFPHTYLIIPIEDNHIFSTFFIPHTTLGQSSFIHTHVITFLSCQNKQSLYTNLIIPLYIQNGAIAKPIFLHKESFTLPLFSFWTRLFIPSKLKAHIASPTHQLGHLNWDT